MSCRDTQLWWNLLKEHLLIAHSTNLALIARLLNYWKKAKTSPRLQFATTLTSCHHSELRWWQPHTGGRGAHLFLNWKLCGCKLNKKNERVKYRATLEANLLKAAKDKRTGEKAHLPAGPHFQTPSKIFSGSKHNHVS